MHSKSKTYQSGNDPLLPFPSKNIIHNVQQGLDTANHSVMGSYSSNSNFQIRWSNLNIRPNQEMGTTIKSSLVRENMKITNQ
ncbi:hypothetical protein CL649_01790 [bacterium]|nr:hypothetical protein [bacterium]